MTDADRIEAAARRIEAAVLRVEQLLQSKQPLDRSKTFWTEVKLIPVDPPKWWQENNLPSAPPATCKAAP